MVWQLRWTLLGLGIIFIVILAWWERRRPRQARGGQGLNTPREPLGDASPRLVRDPPLTLPEIHAREPLGARALPGVDPLRAVPVIEPSAAAPRAASAAHDEIAAEEIADEEIAAEEIGEPDGEAGAWARIAAEETAEADVEAGAPARVAAEDEMLGARQELAAAWQEVPGLGTQPVNELAPADEETLSDMRDVAADEPDDAEALPGNGAPKRDTTPLRRTASAEHTEHTLPRERLPELPATEPPVVEWPSDELRRILAVRLVAPMSERFAGRSLRQALAAEGFMLGQFAIFHKPDDERRAVLSAASLSRPGTFDMETMDSQHYGGLSLFAVLPGPKSPPQAFDELVFTARNLNERLHGVLQDEHGTPLTPARIAQLREQLRAAS